MDEVNLLLQTFFNGQPLPVNFKDKGRLLLAGQPKTVHSRVNVLNDSNSDSMEQEYGDDELSNIMRRDAEVNANLESFRNVLTLSSVSKAILYASDIEKASLDAKIFLVNRDNCLLQNMFNMVESKPARALRHITLDSCQSIFKFFLSPHTFRSQVRLFKQRPLTLANDGDLFVDVADIVNESIATDNKVFVAVRFMLDRPLPSFTVKRSKLSNLRRPTIAASHAGSGITKAKPWSFGFATVGSIMSTVGRFMTAWKTTTADHSQNALAGAKNDLKTATTSSIIENVAGEPSLGTSNGDNLRPEATDDHGEMLNDSSNSELLKQSSVPSQLGGKPHQGPLRRLRINYDTFDDRLEEFTHGWATDAERAYFDSIIVHVHGGGFMAMSSSSHQVYLRKWASELKVPIFSIEYRLAPQTQFPFVLNDVIRAYIWILAFLELIVKAKVRKVIMAGDSSGGNLIFGLVNWCLENGIRGPDSIQVYYPALSLDQHRFTPSFIYSMDDYFLSYSIMKCSVEVYVPPGSDPASNYYISPLMTPPNLLAKYPPIDIFVCERDPLRDDDLRMALALM